MKLNRLLATAALTAVVGPVALFAAPGAYAVGELPADSAPAAPSATAATPAATPEPTAPAGGGADALSPAVRSAAGSSTASGSTAAESSDTAPAPDPTYTRPTFCSGIPDEERGKTSLLGLPKEIVAGSGWHDFTYRVTNVSEIKVMETDISLDLGTADPKLDDTAQLAVTVDWFNTATGAWKPIQGDGAEVLGHENFATVKAIAPGGHTDARMRIKIGDKAEPGTGYFFTIGHSYGEDGQCGFDDISQFDFRVLAPAVEPGGTGGTGSAEGSEGTPGKTTGATPAPGRAEETQAVADTGGEGNTPAPQGAADERPAGGSLASTGSTSPAPALAGIGGAAVVMGAGAIFVVRRRKAGSAA